MKTTKECLSAAEIEFLVWCLGVLSAQGMTLDDREYFTNNETRILLKLNVMYRRQKKAQR